MIPRYSLIIPAYNEEALLGRLLDSVSVAQASYGPPDAIERSFDRLSGCPARVNARYLNA